VAVGPMGPRQLPRCMSCALQAPMRAATAFFIPQSQSRSLPRLRCYQHRTVAGQTAGKRRFFGGGGGGERAAEPELDRPMAAEQPALQWKSLRWKDGTECVRSLGGLLASCMSMGPLDCAGMRASCATASWRRTGCCASRAETGAGRAAAGRRRRRRQPGSRLECAPGRGRFVTVLRACGGTTAAPSDVAGCLAANTPPPSRPRPHAAPSRPRPRPHAVRHSISFQTYPLRYEGQLEGGTMDGYGVYVWADGT
jgi:hypothetical protein